MTNRCLQCGTPLTEHNSDHNVRPTRKYCDNRCKMRYHRTKTKELPSIAFSLFNKTMSVDTNYKFKPVTWERGLFVKPVRFSDNFWGNELGLKDNHYYVSTADADGHELMTELNILYDLLINIEGFIESQGETSKNSFGEDLNDNTDDDICGYFAMYATELPLLEARLLQNQPFLSIFQKSYRTQIRQWIRDMAVTARFFVYENHLRDDKFKVAFDDSFISEMMRARRLIVAWWFDLEASSHKL